MMQIENEILVKYMGDDKEVVIPDGVKVIGEKAFLNCTHLINIIIPKNVTKNDVPKMSHLI